MAHPTPLLPHLPLPLPSSQVALLWMLAEYGEKIPEAPYLLEPMIDEFAEEESPLVRLGLLSSAVKLFFKRPAELQHMLGRLLEAAISDASFTDVHDRAMLYYRLLQHDVNEASRVLGASAPVSGSFVEEAPSELQDRIFEEFNTLAVIYGEPSERFISHERATNVRPVAAPPPEAVAAAEAAPAAPAADDDDDDDSDDDDAPAAAAPPVASSPTMDLLGLMDDLPAVAPAPVAAAPSLALAASAPALAPATFQQHWGSLPVAASWAAPCTQSAEPAALQERMGARHVRCMAFGGGRFYFYGQTADLATTLIAEIVVGGAEATATVKTTTGDHAAAFSDLLKAAL